MTNRESLLRSAKDHVGRDASPFDWASDELSCAESLSSIIKKSIARDFPLELATWRLYKLLQKDKRFQQTTGLLAGNIIISPTGYGNGRIRGHCGILGEGEMIYSSSSATGNWEQNYSLGQWIQRYRREGALPIYVFEPLGDYSKQEELKNLQEQLTGIQSLIVHLQALVSRLTTRSV